MRHGFAGRWVPLALLAVLLATPLWFAGCGGPSKLSAKRLAIATGAKGGTYYPVGEALSKFLAEKFPEVKEIQVIETDGSIQNIKLLEEGKCELALVQNDIAHYAVYGERMFERNRHDKLVGIATLFPEVVQIIARADDSIKSLTDLTNRKVAVGSKDSGTYTNSQQIFSLVEVWDKLKLIEIPAADAPRALEQKQIDAFVYTAGLPTTSIKILASQMAISFIGLSPELTQKLVNKYPFYFPSEIPASTYNGQNNPVQAVEINALLIARKDLADDDVYLISKTLFNGAREIRALHPRLAQFSTQSLHRQLSIPVAAGSQKALAEIEAAAK